MSPTSLETRASDARAAPRTSLYLAATLYHDTSSWPVKIRNISTSGALLEGPVIPPVGSLVQLVRGGLIVHGLVAWSVEGRCGLKFSGSIDVQKWRTAPVNGEQQRVDEVVRLVKAGAVPLPVPSLTSECDSAEKAEAGGEVFADLRRVCDLLDELGASLCADSDVVGRHGTALQNLDIATQVLAALGSVITGRSDPNSDQLKLVGLRRSADQALKRNA